MTLHLVNLDEQTKRCTGCKLELPLGQFRTGRRKCRKCNHKMFVTIRRKTQGYAQQIKLKYGCASCGYNAYAIALCFHHIHPGNKNFRLSDKAELTWNRLRKELSKCVVLCANCHSELHAGIYSANKLNEIYSKKLNNIPGEQFPLWTL